MRPLLLFLLSAAGCAQTLNPCPPGQRVDRRLDRCVATQSPTRDAGPDTALDADITDPHGDEPEADADDADGIEAGDPDAGSEPDGAVQADTDAGTDVDTSVPPVCIPEDIAAWKAGHLREGLVDLISGCYASCKEDASCADSCVHDQIGLQDCRTCSSAQSVCSSASCGAACTVSKSDRMCLACLCEADCVGTFERCSSTQLAVCGAELFGREATEDEHTFDVPLLLRQKGETGGMRAVQLGTAGTSWPTTATHQFSTGFDVLRSFALAGREYVLHGKSTCGSAPCIARISPVLKDGSFGRPLYDARWSSGFDEVELFKVGEISYVLRYKTGRALSEGDPAGAAWIDRIDVATDLRSLALSETARERWLGAAEQPFSDVEPFALSGATFLLLAGTSNGEGQLLRIDAGTPMRFARVGAPIMWPGVDIIETLKVGADWYVFTYDNAAEDPKQGTARLYRLQSSGAGEIELSAALYEAVWSEHVSHAVGYNDEGAAFLITHDQTTGRANQRALPADPATWSETVATVVRTQAVGFNPPWDVVEVAGQGKW